MPNWSRKDEQIHMVMPMDVLSRVHRYFFDGLFPELAGMTDERKSEMLKVLREMEEILQQSGFMSREEVLLRHKEKERTADRRLIVTPYEIGNA